MKKNKIAKIFAIIFLELFVTAMAGCEDTKNPFKGHVYQVDLSRENDIHRGELRFVTDSKLEFWEDKGDGFELDGSFFYEVHPALKVILTIPVSEPDPKNEDKDDALRRALKYRTRTEIIPYSDDTNIVLFDYELLKKIK